MQGPTRLDQGRRIMSFVFASVFLMYLYSAREDPMAIGRTHGSSGAHLEQVFGRFLEITQMSACLRFGIDKPYKCTLYVLP